MGVVVGVNFGIKNLNHLLLENPFDYSQLHLTVIGYLCAHGEIVKGSLLHFPLHEDPLL